MVEPVPFDVTPDEVRIRIETKLRNPNVGRVASVTIKNGPRTFRFATLYEIVNPRTTLHHHFCLRLDSFTRHKANGWTWQKERSVLLGDDTSAELQQLDALLHSALAGGLAQETGDYRLVEAREVASLRDLLKLAKQIRAPGRLRLITTLVENLDVNAVRGAEWFSVFEHGASALNEAVAAAAKLVEYQRTRDVLAKLIDDPESMEQQFQELLGANPWLFGSEYSSKESRRHWTRDDRLDFMLRRTTDNYLEIIEIKTASSAPLFRYDEDRDVYSPRPPLAQALGQAIRYIDEIDRSRDTMIAKDAADPLKVRARLIIGRDGDAGQQVALRNLNGHLHRIEVMTFDQLLRVADRVLGVFQDLIETPANVDPVADFTEWNGADVE